MRNLIPVLAAVVLGTTGASSVAHAALIDFGVSALGGTITFGGGSRLDTSSKLDLDDALLIVTNIGSGDSSGLSLFPTNTDNTVTLTHPIVYGSGSGTMDTPLGSDVFKTWTGDVNGKTDNFTETLTTVTDINRGTRNAITVTLTGTLSDSLGIFVKTPADLILSANQVGGGGSAISAAITNTSAIPEPSTWLMMALGFFGLGYAAVRRSSKDRSALAV